MATITVRNLDDAAYARLKVEAKANHRSLEAEVRARLENERTPRADLIERLFAARIDPGPSYEGSVAIIRAVRDEE